MTALWPLLMLPVLWLLRANPAREGRLSLELWVDLALALALGVGVGLLNASWMADYHVTGGRFIASDFGRYCGNLAAMGDRDWGAWSHSTSLLPAWVLSPLAAQVGVVDALAWGAAGASAVTAAACALWAGALGGRLAGAAAALFTAALGPLVILSRSLTFYPTQVAAYTLALAGASVAMARRTPAALALGSAGVGLALLVDVRGIVVAAPAAAMLLAALARGGLRRLPLRLLCVALPLMGSWWLGARAFPPGTRSLEQQVMALDVRREVAGQLPTRPYIPKTSYLWGSNPPWEIPATLLELKRAGDSLTPATASLPMNVEGRARHLRPWLWPVLVASGAAAWGLRRRPWAALALLMSLAPALITLRSVATLELRLRFLAPAAPGLAVLLGVAFSAAVLGPRPAEEDAGAQRPWPGRSPLPGVGPPLRELLALAALLALITGALPSWLSPVAPRNSPEVAGQIGRALDLTWETEWAETPEARREQLTALAQRMGEAHTGGWSVCEAQLAEDLEAGFEVGGSALRGVRR